MSITRDQLELEYQVFRMEQERLQALPEAHYQVTRTQNGNILNIFDMDGVHVLSARIHDN